MSKGAKQKTGLTAAKFSFELYQGIRFTDTFGVMVIDPKGNHYAFAPASVVPGSPDAALAQDILSAITTAKGQSGWTFSATLDATLGWVISSCP